MKRHGSGWVLGSLCLLLGGLVAGLFMSQGVISPAGDWGKPMNYPRVAADAPIKVFNDSSWASVPGITGLGDMGNPYVISDKVIDAGGTDVGIWIENTTRSFVIRDCSVTGGIYPYGGIYIANASNAMIIGNNCSLNGLGIRLDRQCKNITIKDNNATGSDYHGIIIYNNCSNVRVEANNVSGNTGIGIGISTLSHNNTVVNNNASGNGNSGIFIVQTSLWNNIIQNNCSGNTWYGIGLDSSSANNLIAENWVADNQHNGIYLKDSANNTIKNNIAPRNTGAGLFLEGNAVNNNILNNTFSSNYDGIRLLSVSMNNTFSCNNASANTNRGVNVTVGADGNLFYGNNFSGNGVGQSWDAGAFNRWDNVSVGNFWSDYAGVDANDDLAGDTPYTIGGPASAKDNYPYCDDGNNLAPVILATGLPVFAGTVAPAFALNLVETYLDKIWVSYDDGATNHSCSITGTLPQWSSLGNITFTVTFWANDTNNYVVMIAVLLNKDILAPTLTIPSPAAGTSFPNAPTFTVTVEDSQLDATWYTIGNDNARHYFTGPSFTIDADSWAALPDGEVVIHVHASDTLGNVRAVSVTITKASDLGWLWIVVIGSIVAVVLVIVVLRKNKVNRKTE